MPQANFRKKIKLAEIVVGIPSYNEADSISYVVRQVDKGLQKYFPQKESLIINADNDSLDNTKRVFLNTKTNTPKLYLSTRPGLKGKGYNFLNIFRQAKDLKAQAVVVVDADLKSITTHWIQYLATPIFKGYDYITPFYSRNEYDATITNQICYPLLLGILGTDLRQPIGGDFALSRNFFLYLLRQSWPQAVRKYGVDIFMTLNAVLGSFRLGQVHLGVKIHKPSAPKLGPMFTQVVNTLFTFLLKNKDSWLKFKRTRKIPLLHQNKFIKPPSLSVDYKGMKNTALHEFRSYKELLKRHLSPDVYQTLALMYKQKQVNIDQDLWSKIVYDLLYAYDNSDDDVQIIEGLRPLYFGRVISFLKQTLDFSYQKSESLIRQQAKNFWCSRDYLLDKYKSDKVI